MHTLRVCLKRIFMTSSTIRVDLVPPPDLSQAKTVAGVVFISGPMMGNRAELSSGRLLIGRSEAADLTIPSGQVSREHCVVQVLDIVNPVNNQPMFEIVDLGSTNHTFVNDRQIVKHLLKDGDLIRIGESTMKFFDAGSVEANYQKRLVELAVTDSLTGLNNRRQFMLLLEHYLKEIKLRPAPLALTLVDLDHFKSVNDRFGHHGGDVVLVAAAKSLAQTVPPNGVASRIGGEEFAVLMPGLDVHAARLAADVMRQKISELKIDMESTALSVTASMGVSSMDEAPDSGTLMRLADERLYQAKAGGRNRVC
jgi:diguanylate cyclase (GGDEF)-like protein